METAELTHQKIHRAKVFEELYESSFPLVARFMKGVGGSFEDAKDIFQDALVIFWEKTSEQPDAIVSTPEAYLLGIAKHLWIRKFKDDHKKIHLDILELEISIPEDAPTASQHRLLQFLERTGKKCLDLLRAFYYEKRSMKDLAVSLGYRNERSATVQKHKCLEKIRNTLHTTSLSYEDFWE
jgi:RNA polymerase sigma factor (sigma-70 family)